MRRFPASYSTLSARALGEWIVAGYDLGAEAAVEFFHRGLNDTYRVTASGRRFMLRVYRCGWRSAGEIAYELEALRHAAAKGAAVAPPVPRRDGGFAGVLPAPEGDRLAVLFAFAPGRPLADSDHDSACCGEAAALLHAATADFSSSHRRRDFDLEALLDAPLVLLRPVLDRRPADLAFLEDVAARLKGRVEALAPALEAGFCHGDLHGDNAHIDGERVTFFDFDCCAPGWRAYDIAVFRWRWGDIERGEANWRSFLEGYRRRRSLAPADLEAVPAFVALRAIWLHGLHVEVAEDWGRSTLDDRYWDRFFTHLRQWRVRHLDF